MIHDMKNLIKKIKGVINAVIFIIINRVLCFFTKVEEKKVLFASDVRSGTGGNYSFILEWLAGKGYEVIYDFKADRRVKRGLRGSLALVYKMTISGSILLEDYFRYITFMKVRKGQQICQLWHGAGAFKKFGFSRAAENEGIRIHKGYRKYAKAIVSAEEIRGCYAEAFRIPKENVRATGIPRTDIFFDEKYIAGKKEELIKEFPVFEKKKVILFAPTYRGVRAEDAAYDFDMLDLKKLYYDLNEEHVFVFKWHPAAYNNIMMNNREVYDLKKYGDFFLDLSWDRDINDLLLVTDILITDYSSVIFDYLLVDRPIVYYPYDLAAYEAGRGLYYDYEAYLYGTVAMDQKELTDAIKAGDMCSQKREAFRKHFMEACDGHSTEKTCRWFFEEE